MKFKFKPSKTSEYTRGKGYYLLFMFAVIFFVFWASIDASRNNLPILNSINFYLPFGIVLGLIPIIFDMLTKGEMFEQINTITYEKPRYKILGGRTQLIVVVLVILVLGWKIAVSQTAFIPYPKTQLFDTTLGGSLMSGLFGVMEDWAFFGFLFVSILAIMKTKLETEIFALLPSMIIIGVIFMLYHVFVYPASEFALVSVFVYALMTSGFVYVFRSLVVSNALHFTNNFVGSLVNAGKNFMFG